MWCPSYPTLWGKTGFWMASGKMFSFVYLCMLPFITSDIHAEMFKDVWARATNLHLHSRRRYRASKITCPSYPTLPGSGILMRLEPHPRIPPVFELMLLRRWHTVADPEGGHGAISPPLSLEGTLSAPEETLRVPEGMVCKLQQVFWCPLKGFTDLIDTLSSEGDPLSVWRGPLSSLKGPSELIVGPLTSERLKPQMALSGPQISRGPTITAWGARQDLGALFGSLAPPLAKS